MPWQEVESHVAHLFVRKAHAGVATSELDLFGEQSQRVAARSNAGRSRVALRVMIALLYLKHAFNESDEPNKPMHPKISKRTLQTGHLGCGAVQQFETAN